jgi:hypothetical protein
MNGEDVRLGKNGHEDIRDEEHKNDLNPDHMHHDEGSDIDESPSKPTTSSPP